MVRAARPYPRKYVDMKGLKMSRKIDFTLSCLILIAGLIYVGLTFHWERYGLERAYFPAIALMNVLVGITNILRTTDNQPAIIKCSVAINAIVFGYALYILYLLAALGFYEVAPIIGTTAIAIVLILSIKNLIETLQPSIQAAS